MYDMAETICDRVRSIVDEDGTFEDVLREMVPYSIACQSDAVAEARRRCQERSSDDPNWCRAERLLSTTMTTLPFRRDAERG